MILALYIAVAILGLANAFLTITSIGTTAKLRDEVIGQRDKDIAAINKLIVDLTTAMLAEDRKVLNQAHNNSQAVVDNRILEILAILPTEKLSQA